MKLYSKAELKKKAVEMLTKYSKIEKVHVTSDGQCFADENEHAAKNHAKNNRHKKELSITPFTRDECADELGATPEKTDDNIDELKAILTGDSDLSALDYPTLQKLVKVFELKTDGNKKEALTAALVAERERLKTE